MLVIISTICCVLSITNTVASLKEEQKYCRTSNAPHSRNSRPDRECKFPFKETAEGETFSECAVYNETGQLWCATSTDKNGVMNGTSEWGLCSPKCINEGCKTIFLDGFINHVPNATCVFPFQYSGKTYHECTYADSEDLQPWCATSTSDDGHYIENQWGVCDENCPGGGVSSSKSKKLCCAIKGVPQICIGLCIDSVRNHKGGGPKVESLCRYYESVIKECGPNVVSTNGRDSRINWKGNLTNEEIGEDEEKEESVLLLAVVIVLVAILAIFGTVVIWKRYKDTRIGRNQPMKWENDSMHNSVSSEIISKEDYSYPEWLTAKKEMIFSSNHLERGEKLGNGNYGSVYKGKLSQGKAVFQVAIKVPMKNDASEILSFLEEAKSMIQIDEYHNHIVNLQGIIYESIDQKSNTIKVELLLEFCSRGDLRSYLIQHQQQFQQFLANHSRSNILEESGIESGYEFENDIGLLLRWSYQVADGMNFLSKKNIYHGDLATRNILLTDTLDAKISDFGLSKRLYSDLTTSQPLKKDDEDKLPQLPFKWIALEVLLMQEYVPIKSDVWSYGVLVWEIFSCGKEPYLGIDLVHLIVQLTSGQRLSCPKHCPGPISGLMRECFRENPCDRPGFEEIKGKLHSVYEEMIENSRTKLSLIAPEDSQVYTLPIHKVINDEMRNQYSEMIKENKGWRKHPNKRTEKAKISESTSLHYASLEKLKSPASDHEFS